MKVNQLSYFVSGLTRRFWQKSDSCPSCGGREATTYERKYFHQLLKCEDCGLLFRFPYETGAEMAKFYQDAYQQDGLTTDLPNRVELEELVNAKFVGSAKDGSRFLKLFKALSIAKNARVLDYGANWGYGTWQFRQAGYDAHGYEISVPRAVFGEHLGLEIITNWQTIDQKAPFDLVFSAHVLEHTPDPAKAIHQQIGVLRSGGYLVALFPNGSRAFRDSSPRLFHRLWGQVHPVMLNDDFVRHVFPTNDLFMGACAEIDMPAIANWRGIAEHIASINTNELLVVWKKN